MYEPKIDSVQLADLAQIVREIEELHPLVFRKAFGLTHEEAAEELGLEPQTMRAYSKKEPSKRVKKLAATLTKQWLLGERQLVDAQALIHHLPSNSRPSYLS
jgi:predicted DNA-binding protein (UPF0251 family)